MTFVQRFGGGLIAAKRMEGVQESLHRVDAEEPLCVTIAQAGDLQRTVQASSEPLGS